MNLYGYADGDPINNSDPFGLCPIAKDGIPCSLTRGAAGAVGGLVAGATIGATGGTFVVPGVGTVVGAAGGALVGSVSGALAGATVGLAEDVMYSVDWGAIGSKIRRGIGIAGVTIGALGSDGKVARDVIRAKIEQERLRREAEQARKQKQKENEASGGEPPPETPSPGARQ